jgi:hypothetical protein
MSLSETVSVQLPILTEIACFGLGASIYIVYSATRVLGPRPGGNLPLTAGAMERHGQSRACLSNLVPLEFELERSRCAK